MGEGGRVQEGDWGQEWGLGGIGSFQCGTSTYKQVKFLGKILEQCCGNSFSFLKWSGGSGAQGGILDNGL